VRVHSDAFKRDSKSGRRFIHRVLAQRDCTVVVNYTDVDAADVVHMLDALHHRCVRHPPCLAAALTLRRKTVIEDFETPQWLSVYKAAVHFRLHGLFRLAAAHLEERLPEMERFNLACAYMHRAWLVELLPQYMTPACTPNLDLRRMLRGFAAFIRTHRELRRTAPPGMSAQEREDVLRRHCPTYLGMLRDYPPRPAWAVPWELTPAEARVFKRFGKWQPDVPAERTGDGAAAVGISYESRSARG
jgi:hypothetical protein